jgi:hypothetical protein
LPKDELTANSGRRNAKVDGCCEHRYAQINTQIATFSFDSVMLEE